MTSFNAALTGPYTLTMGATADDYGNDAAHDTSLALGEIKQGRIDYTEDVDWFALQAVAGHQYAITLASQGRPGEWYQSNFEFYLADPDYGNLECSYIEDFTRCVLTATETRSYAIPVMGDYGLPSYTLHAADITASLSQDIQVLNEQTPLPLSFDGNGNVERFQIEAVGGVTYRFTTLPTASALDFAITDGSGALESSPFYDWHEPEGMRNPGEWIWAPRETGTYYLAVASFDATFVGQYTLALESAANPTAAFWARETLGIGVPLVSEMRRDHHDGFVRFDAEGGVSYRFTVRSPGWFTTLKLLDSEGEELAPGTVMSRGEPGEDVVVGISWTAPASGAYYLSVDGASDFTLTADTAPAPPPPPLPPQPSAPPPTPDELIAFSHASIVSDEEDVFRFHAVAGRNYMFRTVLDTLDDSILGVFDPQAQRVIAVNDDTDDEEIGDDDAQLGSSEVRWMAEKGGDVYLIVYGFDSESTGTYRVEVYSTSAALKDETLVVADVAPAAGEAMASAVDNELYSNVDDPTSNDWDDSNDSDVWEGDEGDLDW